MADRKPAPPSKAPATTFYCDVMRAIDLQRRRKFGSMEKVSEYIGLADRAYSKLLHPNTPSGRQGQWATVQLLIDALYPDGCEIEIRPKPGPKLAEITAEFRRRYPKKMPVVADGPRIPQSVASP